MHILFLLLRYPGTLEEAPGILLRERALALFDSGFEDGVGPVRLLSMRTPIPSLPLNENCSLEINNGDPTRRRRLTNSATRKWTANRRWIVRCARQNAATGSDAALAKQVGGAKSQACRAQHQRLRAIHDPQERQRAGASRARRGRDFHGRLLSAAAKWRRRQPVVRSPATHPPDGDHAAEVLTSLPIHSCILFCTAPRIAFTIETI